MESDRIHAMMIASSVSAALDSKRSDSDLKGTLTDKINVENFCYNYQKYVLHPTVQFSEEDARKCHKKVVLLNQINNSVDSAHYQKSSFRLESLKTTEFMRHIALTKTPSVRSIREQPSGTGPSADPLKNNFTPGDQAHHEPTPSMLLSRASISLQDIKKMLPEEREAIKSRIEARAKKKLRRFFHVKPKEHCLLFMSGHGNARATFLLNNTVRAQLSLKDILELWDESPKHSWTFTDKWGMQKEMRSHLLIVIDACQSGSWTRCLEREIRREFNDISIQSSSNNVEKSYDDDTGQGGFFMSNFLCVNGLKDLKYSAKYRQVGPDGRRKDLQHPTFYSRLKNLEQVYRLRIGFQSWEELEWRVSESLRGTFIGENGDVLKGEFKSVQLHGAGSKRMANGRTEEGEFFNDKLDGKGHLVWGGLMCHGLFKGGQLESLYSAQLSYGQSVNGFERNEAIRSKYNLIVQDDIVQELDRVNCMGQCRGSYDWIRSFFANSDISEGMHKNGAKHGLNFHYRRDGGFSFSFWIHDTQLFRYSVDSKGTYEYSTYVRPTKRPQRGHRRSNSGLPEQTIDDSADEFYSCSGKVATVFNRMDKAGWEHFEIQKDLSMSCRQMRYVGSRDKKVPTGEGEYSDGSGLSYKGSWKEGLPEGKGTLKLADGSVYEGFWAAGFRHGLGTMFYPNGDIYVGEWRVDHIMGPGKYEFAKGVIYKGPMFAVHKLADFCPVNLKNQTHSSADGQHLLQVYGWVKKSITRVTGSFSDSQISVGGSRSTIRTVQFKANQSKRHIYTGEVVGERMHGFGVLTTKDKTMFEGEYFEDKLVVENYELTLPDGSRYSGDCLMRRRQESDPPSRWTYQGMWEFTAIHGKGHLKASDGSVYEGMFSEGKKTGSGKLVAPDGEVYEGEFVDDQFEGKGCLRKVSGEVFEGVFKNNQPFGQGTIRAEDGCFYRGEFYGNIFQSRYEVIESDDGSMYMGQVAYRRRRPEEAIDRLTLGGIWTYIGAHGNGKQVDPNGEVFEGEFKWGKRMGRGTLTLRNGEVFEGVFTEDRYQAEKVEIRLGNGAVYMGQVVYEKKTGKRPVDSFALDNTWFLTEIKGRGTLTRPNGEVQEGDLDGGLFVGPGKLVMPDGKTYEGCFNGPLLQMTVNDVLLPSKLNYTGTALFKRKTGNEPPSALDIDGLWSFREVTGEGVGVSPDGTSFEGCFEKGLRHGQGKLRFKTQKGWEALELFAVKDTFQRPRTSFKTADGWSYSGECVMSLRDGSASGPPVGEGSGGVWCSPKCHGEGELKSPAGNVFTGDFYMDMLLCQHIQLSFSDGSVYSGDCLMVLRPPGNPKRNSPNPMDAWKYHAKHGFGRLTLPDKSYYDGEFWEDHRHGMGTFETSEGVRHSGQYVEGKREGRGEIHWPNGSKAEGRFFQDHFWSGEVTLLLAKGERYERRHFFDWIRHQVVGRDQIVTPVTGDYPAARLAQEMLQIFPKMPKDVSLLWDKNSHHSVDGPGLGSPTTRMDFRKKDEERVVEGSPNTPHTTPSQANNKWYLRQDAGLFREMVGEASPQSTEIASPGLPANKAGTNMPKSPGLKRPGSLSGLHFGAHQPNLSPQVLNLDIKRSRADTHNPSPLQIVSGGEVVFKHNTADFFDEPKTPVAVTQQSSALNNLPPKPSGSPLKIYKPEIQSFRGFNSSQVKPKTDPKCKYEGQLKDGAYDGIGKLTTARGSFYEGEFVKGRLYGKGRITKPNGHTIEGYFVPVDGEEGKYLVTPWKGDTFQIDFPEPQLDR